MLSSLLEPSVVLFSGGDASALLLDDVCFRMAPYLRAELVQVACLPEDEEHRQLVAEWADDKGVNVAWLPRPPEGMPDCGTVAHDLLLVALALGHRAIAGRAVRLYHGISDKSRNATKRVDLLRQLAGALTPATGVQLLAPYAGYTHAKLSDIAKAVRAA